MKKLQMILAMAMTMAAMTACTEKPADNGDGGDGSNTGDGISGEVSGVWEANSVVKVSGHITVPEGKTLRIEEGVEVIFSHTGVGVNHVPVEFTVDGSLYCEGTEESPVVLTVDESQRTDANALKGLWGGIVATAKCPEMIIDHTVIEYTGGQVIEGSPAATAGIYEAGDDAYPQITTNNIAGKYVITNSVLRNGWSDAIYLMGGNAIIAGNVFSANGYDGGEAVNVKAGCKADVAGNVMFSPNTNGLKLSSSGQSENRAQALVQAYNNTVVNAGWRRDGEKGGCIYVEKNVLANVFNNLMVNCKFRAMTPSYDIPDNPEEGYDDDSVIDWNFYASGSQKSDIVFEDESGVAYAWEGYNYAHEDYSPDVDRNSVVASENDLKDPMFVNFSVSEVPLTEYLYEDSWDFHVKAGSPVLSGAYSGQDSAFAPYFAAEGLVVDGRKFVSPQVRPYFGAFGE